MNGRTEPGGKRDKLLEQQEREKFEQLFSFSDSSERGTQPDEQEKRAEGVFSNKSQEITKLKGRVRHLQRD